MQQNPAIKAPKKVHEEPRDTVVQRPDLHGRPKLYDINTSERRGKRNEATEPE